MGRGKSADGCCQANRPRHGCRPKRNAAAPPPASAACPAKARSAGVGGCTALVHPAALFGRADRRRAALPSPPFPNPGGLPGRPVGGGAFSSPGAQTSPFWGARGGRSLEAFFLRAPGTCPGKNGASKGGKAGRIAKNRKGSRRTGCRPEEEQRKDGARPKRGAAPLWRTRAAADMAASGGGCLNPEAVACSGSGCPGSHSGQDGPLQGLLRAAAALCGVPRRKSAPTARPGGRDAALLPDGGSRYNGRGGYAQRLPRAVPL